MRKSELILQIENILREQDSDDSYYTYNQLASKIIEHCLKVGMLPPKATVVNGKFTTTDYFFEPEKPTQSEPEL